MDDKQGKPPTFTPIGLALAVSVSLTFAVLIL